MMASKRTVLIVEDNEDMCQSLEARLKEDGHQVFTAANFGEGLAHLKENEISFLVLDLLLGGEEGMSGPDLVKAAQEDTAIDFDAIHILVLSDWSDVASVLGDVLPVSRYDFLYKPKTSLDDVAEHIKSKIDSG